MEFMCDKPKSAPVPTPLDQDCIFPSVPEVSMIFSNDNDSSHNQDRSMYMSYDAWKKSTKKYSADGQPRVIENKENLTPSPANRSGTNGVLFSYENILQLRKQVHFENTVLQQKTCSKETVVNDPTSALSNRKTSPSEETQFEQIYMANVPNRNLDLSVIETVLPKNNTVNKNNTPQLRDVAGDAIVSQKFLESSDNFSPLKPKVLGSIDTNTHNVNNNSDLAPKTYKEFCAKNQTESRKMGETCSNCRCCQSEKRTPIFFDSRHFAPVHSRELDIYSHSKNSYNKISTDTQTSYIFHDNRVANCNKNIIEAQTTDNEPTTKDLLKIIQQQNEQLLTLQKQVSLLLEQKERPKTIETVSAFREIGMANEAQENVYSEKYVTSTQHETVGAHLKTPKKGPLPKFSIGVTTSFAVSLVPQQNFQPRTKHFKNYPNVEPKIQEITEVSSDKKGVGDCIDTTSNNSIDFPSLNLNGYNPIRTSEDCSSPENSIRIDMESYSYDDTDDETTSDDAEWSIYNNVVHQVEKTLKRNKMKCERKTTGKEDCDTNKERNSRTMKKVKKAAIRHLKRIGVELSDTDESVDTEMTNNTQEYTPTEISFAVKQLLMKYLPDEHLTVLTRKPSNNKVTKVNYNPIKNRPEFSFATMQYMKKYNLITQNGTQEDQNVNIQELPPTQTSDFSKMLDTTALKHQPKLL